MASPQETRIGLPNNPDAPGIPQSPNGYFGWVVERRMDEPHEFPQAPAPDVFNRVPAMPKDIAAIIEKVPQPKNDNQLAETPPSPWGFLPKGAFYIENGGVIQYQEVAEDLTRRARENLMVTSENEHRVYPSARRQKANGRTFRNARKTDGNNKPRGGIRPQQGGHR